MKLRYLLPLLVFMFIAIILWRGLGLHPAQIPSPLIDKPAPSFELPNLLDSKPTTNKDFLGHVSLVNVWATWCYACAEEHAFLLTLAKNPDIMLFGLNYKDDPTAAKKWLEQYGNPYQMVAVDRTGNVGIDWGVYGTPETFVVDKHGIIRFKYIGPLTPEVWNQTLKPLVDRLRNTP
jgi:cytochrome c biogenesis protein CcmG/thiol:disulfide interchange protein DsbE